jgi:hypothetical protein
LGGNEGGLALAHHIDHLAQDVIDLIGEWNPFPVGAKEESGPGMPIEKTGQV